jgi:hypothetical protein
VTVRAYKSWTDKEVRYLRSHYGKMSLKDMANALGRTVNSVKKFMYEHDLANNVGRKWTAQEIAYLRSHYGQKPSHDIAKKLGRSVGAIRVVASKFGIVSAARDDIAQRTASAWADILGVTRQSINMYVSRGELRLDEESKGIYFRTQVISDDSIEDWLRRGYALRCHLDARIPKYWRDIIAEVKAQYMSITELRKINGMPDIRTFNMRHRGIGKPNLEGIHIGVGKERDVYYRKAEIYEAIYAIGHVMPRTIKDPYVKAVLMAWDSVYVATWQLMPYYRPRKDRTHPEAVIRGVYNRGEIVTWLRTRKDLAKFANVLRQDPISWQELHADINRKVRLGQPL